MGIPAPLPFAAWRSARTPLTLFRAEGSRVGPHGPSCQLGGEAGRLAGGVHVPRLRGCYEGCLSTVLRMRARFFVKPFVKTFVETSVTPLKPSTGAALRRFVACER